MSQMKVKKLNQSSVRMIAEYHAYDYFYNEVEHIIQGLSDSFLNEPASFEKYINGLEGAFTNQRWTTNDSYYEYIYIGFIYFFNII